eukprot:659920-Pleurochrysis_carterae.AAC.2
MAPAGVQKTTKVDSDIQASDSCSHRIHAPYCPPQESTTIRDRLVAASPTNACKAATFLSIDSVMRRAQ